MPLVTGTFATQAEVTSVLYDRKVAQVSTKGDGSQVQISYDSTDNSYTLRNGGQNFRFGPIEAVAAGSDYRFERTSGGNEERLLLSRGSPHSLDPVPRYVREGLFYSSTLNFIDDERTYSTSSFVFGLPSEAAAVATTGRAALFITLRGTHSGANAGGSPYDTLTILSGSGSVQVDFATGKLEIAASTWSNNTLGQSSSAFAIGQLSGTASITSGRNLFAGNFTANHVDGAGPLVYTGAWQGQFYGPQADEIGGTLYGRAGDQFYSASFAGREFSDVLAGQTMGSLVGFTRFRGTRVGYNFPDNSVLDSNRTEYFVAYNATTQTWETSTSLFQLPFEPRNRVPANDSNDMLAFRATQELAEDGEAEYEIALFDGSAQGITLTYSSFMNVLGSRYDKDDALVATSLDWIGFGIATPLHQIPVSGTGRYSGLLAGTLRNNANILARFGGASQLEVDFLSRTLIANLSPSGLDAGGAPISYGTYSFTGNLSALDGELIAALGGGNGSLRGRLYGNAGQEYVATFAITDPALGSLDGVSFGTRTPPP